MKKRYTKLKLRERERLAIGLAKGKSLRRIARELGRSHSTLSRELKNHHISENLETYSPSQSNAVARIFRRRAGRKRVMKNELICKYVEKKIKGGWSPEQISGRLSLSLQVWEYRMRPYISTYMIKPIIWFGIWPGVTNSGGKRGSIEGLRGAQFPMETR